MPNFSDNRILRLVISSLFSALCCIATVIIMIPSPGNGYINLGDCFVLLSGFLLGPVWGSLAAGIGSALADILAGYAFYAPATFIIKAAMAFSVFYFCRLFSRIFGKHITTARILSAVICAAIMIAGYFGYAAVLLGNGLSAAASIPANAVQGVAGAAGFVLLSEIFTRTPALKSFFDRLNT